MQSLWPMTLLSVGAILGGAKSQASPHALAAKSGVRGKYSPHFSQSDAWAFYITTHTHQNPLYSTQKPPTPRWTRHTRLPPVAGNHGRPCQCCLATNSGKFSDRSPPTDLRPRIQYIPKQSQAWRRSRRHSSSTYTASAAWTRASLLANRGRLDPRPRARSEDQVATAWHKYRHARNGGPGGGFGRGAIQCEGTTQYTVPSSKTSNEICCRRPHRRWRGFVRALGCGKDMRGQELRGGGGVFPASQFAQPLPPPSRDSTRAFSVLSDRNPQPAPGICTPFGTQHQRCSGAVPVGHSAQVLGPPSPVHVGGL